MFQATEATSTPPAHVRRVPRGLYANFQTSWVCSRGGRLGTEAVCRTWHFRAIKGAVAATETRGPGAGMFQQKVLFAEHVAEPASRRWPSPFLTLLLS